MTICYCKTGGYGRFLQVVEQKQVQQPVQQKVEERQETELAKPSTHKNPRPNDSLERIADELEEAEKWCDKDGRYFTGIVSISVPKIHEWSDRIRKLAKKTGGDAHGN